MKESIIDFFKKLPPKKCAKCGNTIAEQHECYGTRCDKCTNL